MALGVRDGAMEARLLSFGINLATISGTAVLAYAILHLREGNTRAFRSSR